VNAYDAHAHTTASQCIRRTPTHSDALGSEWRAEVHRLTEADRIDYDHPDIYRDTMSPDGDR